MKEFKHLRSESDLFIRETHLGSTPFSGTPKKQDDSVKVGSHSGSTAITHCMHFLSSLTWNAVNKNMS